MLLYLADHDGCMMSELNRDVLCNRSIPELLERIERAGTVERVREGRTTRIFLTDKGKLIVGMLEDIGRMFDNEADD